MSLLAARALAIGYGDKSVARDIDLNLAAGSVTCLIGPNGVGKTTLFKTLLGLLPALGGTIDFGGEPMTRLTRETVARHIAYVPQAHQTDFAFTVFDLVLMGRTAHIGPTATPSRKDRAAAEEALARLNLTGLARADMNRISGGQRQLALIARAIAQESRAIVMDEPTASLDIANRILVLDTIRALSRSGLAIFLSTHEPEQAFEIADRVAILSRDGRFAAGPTADILTTDALSALYGVALAIERTSSGRAIVTPAVAQWPSGN